MQSRILVCKLAYFLSEHSIKIRYFTSTHHDAEDDEKEGEADDDEEETTKISS